MSYLGLHPSLKDFVSEIEFVTKSTTENRDPIEFRNIMAERASKLVLQRPKNMVVSEKKFNTDHGDVKARIYRSKNAPKNSPLLVYMHGGGWIIGDLNSHDAVCVDIALDCNMTVMAIEYALAPEHPYPVALNQCSWIYKEVHNNADKFSVDPNKIAVGGDSAGGNLALALCLKMRNEGFKLPLAQLLIYPCVDLDFNSPSYLKHSKAPFLDRDSMIWIWNTYLQNNLDINDPLAVPAFEKNYEGLPPTLVVSAELDPLAHEGKALVKRLIDANVPSMHFECQGLIHGFIRCRDQSAQAALEFKNLTKSLSLFMKIDKC
jgi:acetyl esterase